MRCGRASPFRGPTVQAAAVALVLLIAPPLTLFGQSVDGLLTLEQAVAIAVEHNQGLEAAHADLSLTRAALDEAQAHRRPRLDLVASFQRTNNPVLVFGNLLRQGSFTAESFELTSLNQPDALSHWSAQLSLAQPVWTGGRIAAAIAASRLQHDAARDDGERARQEVVHQVITTYSSAVLATSQLEVAEEALRTAQAHVELVRDSFQVGLVVESDLLQAQVRESEIQELVIRGRNGVKISRAALNLAMGLDQEGSYSLPRELEGETPGKQDLDELIATARARRPDLLATSSRLQATGQGVRLARAASRPEIGLSGLWETNAEGGFGGDSHNWSVLATLRLKLFDGMGSRATIRQAQETERRARALRNVQEQSISLEVRQTYFDVQASQQRLEQTVKGVELARKSLTIVEDRYREGLTTLPDLLDTETALTRARMRQVAAQRDVLIAQASLDLATGSLTADRGSQPPGGKEQLP